jgi:hypothetical protein
VVETILFVVGCEVFSFAKLVIAVGLLGGPSAGNKSGR